MDIARNRLGHNLLIKPNRGNKVDQPGGLLKKAILNNAGAGSLTNQIKRTALSATTNIHNKLASDTSKLSLKSLKEELPDPIKVKKAEVAEIKAPENKARVVSKPPTQAQATGSQKNVNSTQNDLEKISKIPRLSIRPQSVAELLAKRETISFSTNIIPEDVENIDENDSANVFLTTDYVNDIYNYLRCLENKYRIKNHPLVSQKEYTPKMRSILVDWLISVHYQFHLTSETLYMTVGILDRFCQNENVSKNKVQLVGITSMFIASKYEEIYPPELNDFVGMCDGLYHKRDIIKMEISILKGLKFELGRPLPLHFLRRMSKAAHADAVIHTMAKYLMELCLVEYECTHWDPSLVAATALFTTLKMIGDGHKWTSTLKYYSHYNEENLRPFVTILCKIILKAPSLKFQSCRKKYGSPKFSSISKRPELESQIVKDMAQGIFSAKEASQQKR